jgi:hypothetical protein
MIHSKALQSLLLLACSFLPVGCSSLGLTDPAPIWVVQEAPMVSERVLWVVCENAMVKQGFPVLTNEFDPKTREAHSGWQLDLHPFKGQGFRERAVIKYGLGSAGKLEIRVRIEREINANLAKPLDPSLAKWEREADNEQRAQILLQTILSTLETR